MENEKEEHGQYRGDALIFLFYLVITGGKLMNFGLEITLVDVRVLTWT